MKSKYLKQIDFACLFSGSLLNAYRSAIVRQDALTEISTPTTEQIEIRVAKAKARWQTPLNDSVTPQFPRETDRLHTSVDSAIQQSSKEEDTASKRPASPLSPRVQRSKSSHMPMSPSVYSRNTDGVSILPNDSVMSLASPCEQVRVQQEGSAVVLKSQSVRSYVIGTPSPNRPSSTRSSRDWKAWLSQEVSGIEASSQEDRDNLEQYAAPSRQREYNSFETVRSSQTGSGNVTVILRNSLDISTPRADSRNSGTVALERQHDVASDSERVANQSTIAPGDVLDSREIRKSSSCGHTQSLHHIGPSKQLQIPDCSTPPTRENFSTARPRSMPSSPQPLLGTPSSARMNDRFPYIDTGRSSSRNSSQSCHSKSPTDSVILTVNSSKATSESKVMSHTVPVAMPCSATATAACTTSDTAQTSQKGKENITPPSTRNYMRTSVSPLALVPGPKSSHLHPSAVLDRSITKIANQMPRSTGASWSKRASCPADTVVARPNLRVTLRPIPQEKLARRPRSAFDLRDTPPRRPASGLPRPLLKTKWSSPLSACNREPIAGACGSEDTGSESSQRDGSITPGRRMAERFIQQRKSAAILERGIRRSSGKFVREDTPAFL